MYRSKMLQLRPNPGFPRQCPHNRVAFHILYLFHLEEMQLFAAPRMQLFLAHCQLAVTLLAQLLSLNTEAEAQDW